MTHALVLFSGGQDSTTCLAVAKAAHDKVFAVTFDYNQRHRIELDQARYLAAYTNTDLQIIKVPFLSTHTTNALTRHNHVIEQSPQTNLPTTFVPGRNNIFLTLAASLAYELGIKDIYTGVCEADYSGYPDCRASFIAAATHAISLSLDQTITIHAPLLHKTKAAAIQWMQALGKLDWYQYTHTCYLGTRPACGTCPACVLRLAGFAKAGVTDPLAYR